MKSTPESHTARTGLTDSEPMIMRDVASQQFRRNLSVPANTVEDPSANPEQGE